MQSKANIFRVDLPGVDQIAFIFEDGKVAFDINGEALQIKKFCITANGLHDLCICLGEDGNPTIKEIAKTPKEKVLWVPTHDLLSLTFDQPIATKGSIIVEIDERISKIVDKLVQFTGGDAKGCDYYMYGGKHYGEPSS
jgi:hypothetical protein